MNRREQRAVENFLASLSGLTQHEAYENARLDARLYRWSPEALTAIIDGIGAAKLPIVRKTADDAPSAAAIEERDLLDREEAALERMARR